MPHSEYWPFTTNDDFNGEPSLLQKQLGLMEGEVKEIQMELAAIKRDRMDLRVRKQTTGGTEPDAAVRDALNTSLKEGDGVAKFDEVELPHTPQIARLREELIRAKNLADEERFQREKYEAKLLDLENKLNGICRVGVMQDKESRKITNEEVNALKNQVRDLNEEIEELKIGVAEKTEQLEEYRGKYLQAQQQVEELRRQLEILDFDNRQVSDQIQVEIQKMKMQFQSKLQELAPLPELLQGARAQLHEARQLQAIAEEGARTLAAEMQLVNEKLLIAVNNLNQEKAERSKLAEENQALKLTIEEQRAEIEQLNASVDDYKCQVVRLDEKRALQEARDEQRSAECARLARELDAQRAEAARALQRGRERADAARGHLRAQISELERQLAQSRAHCRACQRERDEIRQRMQLQISNLQETFELTEIRLRALQNQVASLKNTYTLILADEQELTRDDNKIATP